MGNIENTQRDAAIACGVALDAAYEKR